MNEQQIKTQTIKREIGNAGECAVAKHLQNQGFMIIAQNYTVRGGEIDIIATKEQLMIFVEVKTRTKTMFPLSQVITITKQKKIILTAKYFLNQYTSKDLILRFDVALVQDSTITYIPSAFSDSSSYSYY